MTMLHPNITTYKTLNNKLILKFINKKARTKNRISMNNNGKL